MRDFYRKREMSPKSYNSPMSISYQTYDISKTNIGDIIIHLKTPDLLFYKVVLRAVIKNKYEIVGTTTLPINEDVKLETKWILIDRDCDKHPELKEFSHFDSAKEINMGNVDHNQLENNVHYNRDIFRRIFNTLKRSSGVITIDKVDINFEIMVFNTSSISGEKHVLLDVITN